MWVDHGAYRTKVFGGVNGSFMEAPTSHRFSYGGIVMRTLLQWLFHRRRPEDRNCVYVEQAAMWRNVVAHAKRAEAAYQARKGHNEL